MNGWTIVFDLDGTFVDTAPDLVGATNYALADLALPPVAGGQLLPWVSFGARRMIVEALKLSGHPTYDTEPDRLLGLFLQYYEANIARDSRAFPHAVETIKALKRDGFRCAICTNKRESLSLSLLKELDLSTLWDAVAGRDTLPVHKPDPGHLTGTIALAGGTANRTIMVGDSDVDVATARAAGIPIIGVTFGYTHIPMADLNPDVLISDYSELFAAIASLGAPVNVPRDTTSVEHN